MLNIMAVGAHPDDIEIFMYGFMAAAKARGDKLHLVVATDGGAGGTGPDLASRRANETRLALKPLGSPTLLNLPDGQLASDSSARKKITATIQKIAPDLILTHSPEDYHPDHRALSAYVNDGAGFSCPILYADTLMGIGFTPDYYIDISPHAAAKREAIMAHESQSPTRFAEAAQIMNRYRAAQCNAPDGHYAEAYRLEKRFPFADIRPILPAPPPYRPFYIPDSDALI